MGLTNEGKTSKAHKDSAAPGSRPRQLSWAPGRGWAAREPHLSITVRNQVFFIVGNCFKIRPSEFHPWKELDECTKSAGVRIFIAALTITMKEQKQLKAKQ